MKNIWNSKWTTSNFYPVDSVYAGVPDNSCLFCFFYVYLMFCRFKVWPKLLLIFVSKLLTYFRKLAQDYLLNTRYDWVAWKTTSGYSFTRHYFTKNIRQKFTMKKKKRSKRQYFSQNSWFFYHCFSFLVKFQRKAF